MSHLITPRVSIIHWRYGQWLRRPNQQTVAVTVSWYNLSATQVPQHEHEQPAMLSPTARRSNFHPTCYLNLYGGERKGGAGQHPQEALIVHKISGIWRKVWSCDRRVHNKLQSRAANASCVMALPWPSPSTKTYMLLIIHFKAIRPHEHIGGNLK